MTKYLTSLFLALSVFAVKPVAAADLSTLITLGDTTVMELSRIVATGLTTVYVETIDHEEPTCEYVYAPTGCMGATIRNATKVPGRVTIYQRINGMDSVLYDSGDYEKDVSGMTIKLRGNTSAFEAKKPYKIKLQKKQDLLFRGDESTYKDKDWLLLKDEYLFTTTGFKVSKLMGMTWVPGCRYVNVILNNDYKGVYLLCESVKRNPDCRLNVDKNSGFIFECDPYWWNEDVYVSSITSPSYNFTFKYPESEDILPEQLEYMQDLVSRYEASLTKSNYPTLIDVPSFAHWCLVHDLMGTKDSGGANRYYTKYDTTAESLIVMPVVWDFDMSERMPSDWSRCHTSHMTKLFNNSNRTYVDAFAGRWYDVRATLLSEITQFLNDFGSSPEAIAMQASFNLEKLVSGRQFNVAADVSSRKSWFNSRFTWMNNKIKAMNPIGDVNVDSAVNIADVTDLISALMSGQVDYVNSADVNNDGAISIQDITVLISLLMGQS